MDDAVLPEPSGRRLGGDDLPPGLQPYVLEVYEQYLPAPPGPPFRFALSATTTPNLNVTLEGAGHIVMPVAYGGQTVALDAFSLAGPQPHPFVVEVATATRGLDVLFTPVGPYALLGVTDYRLTAAGPPPLHTVVRPDLAEAVRAWRDAILAAPPHGTPPEAAFDVRAAAIVTFLAERVPAVPPEAAFLQRAVSAIEAAAGNIRVADLADRLRVPNKTVGQRSR